MLQRHTRSKGRKNIGAWRQVFCVSYSVRKHTYMRERKERLKREFKIFKTP
jgi:hypothetical protein